MKQKKVLKKKEHILLFSIGILKIVPLNNPFG